MAELATAPVQDTPITAAVNNSIEAALKATPVAEAPKVEEVKTETKIPTDEPKAAPAVDEKFDLKMPEGSLLDPARAEEIAAFSKAQGLSKAQAQAILDRENGAVSGYVEKQKQTLKSESVKWVQDLAKDTEIGGEAFLKNSEMAKRVVKKFGSESFVRTLEDTGLGNHPELVRTFVRIGKAFGEDQLVLPKVQGTSGNKKSLTELFYDHPSSQKKE